MTGAARAQLAREFLDGACKRRVTELPPSLLVRECAELRRHLDQLLAAIAAGECLDEDQVAVIVAALEDAAEYREYQASLTCAECAVSPVDLCEDHAAKLDAAGAYRALARQLGGA